MAATYTSVANVHPANARVASITLCEEGDQIDLIDVLGRPARVIQMYLSDPADTIEYRLNSAVRLRTSREHEISLSQSEKLFGTYGTQTTIIFSGADRYPLMTSQGSIVEIANGLAIHSIEIGAVTQASTSSTFTMVVW